MPMSRAGLVLAVIAPVILSLAGCTDDREDAPRQATIHFPGPAVPPLDVRLAKVTGVALKGRPSRGPLLDPAEDIQRTITRMYSEGFMDPLAWQRGYRGVLDAFAPDLRGRARQDLNQLTLGGSAKGLTEIRSANARIVVEFLPNEKKQPVAAMTDMRFIARGFGQGFEIPIRHDG
ncbi:MAG: hypothetical protein M3135_04725, partial [Actinomycetota bacterium]|nr:hypothetical protein [Actinomycetota bacterium]